MLGTLRISTIARYTLLEALRTRLPALVVAAIAALLAASAFVETISITEGQRLQTGFYAAGECEYQYHGANRLGANALVACIYAGKIGGPAMVAYARQSAKAPDAVPSSGLVEPAISFRSVDLPAPLMPMTHQRSLRPIIRSSPE